MHSLLDALPANFNRPAPSRAYRLALFPVAAVMVALPAVYLGLMAAVLWALYHHYTAGLASMELTGITATVFLAVTPALLGGILLLFLLKPLVARREKPAGMIRLDPETHPQFFAFVRRLCSLLGAPEPYVIRVNLDVNAAAAFEGGWTGMLRRRLALTVGTPLLGGVAGSDLAGVLAHELGHFGQKTGMTCTWIVCSMHTWFAEVVYGRDRWDETLVQYSHEGSWYTMLLCGISRVLIWLVRLFLRMLMWLGTLASYSLMRRMEFDADRYVYRLIGSAAFSRNMTSLAAMSLAAQGSHQSLERAFKRNKIPDDLNPLIVAAHQAAPPAALEELEQHLLSEQTRSMDIHPSTGERVEAARAAGAAPAYEAAAPACELLTDFDRLCKQVTLAHYEDVLELPVPRGALVPASVYVDKLQGVVDARNALVRFGADTLNALRPMEVAPPPAGPVTPGKAAADRVRAARADFEANLEAAYAAALQFDEAYLRLTVGLRGEALARARVKFDPVALGLPGRSVEELRSAQADAQRDLDSLEEILSGHDRRALERLAASLAALATPSATPGIADREAKLEQAAVWARFTCTFVNFSKRVRNMARDFEKLRMLVENVEALIPYGPGADMGVTLASAIDEHMRSLNREFSLLEHPYGDLSDSDNLAESVLAEFPESLEPPAVAFAADEFLDRTYDSYYFSLGKLAELAEEVETELGLEPVEPL